MKKNVAGEIRITSNTRSLDDPIKTFDISIVLREVESTISCGLRHEWISGENYGSPFKLHSGAGSRWMTFTYGERRFCVDMAEAIEAFISAIEAEKIPKAKVDPPAEQL